MARTLQSLHHPAISKHYGSGCRCSRVKTQADQVLKSFNLKPVIQQIDHLLQRESGLLASRC